MDTKKLLLYALLALLGTSLWSAWQHEHQAANLAATTAAVTAAGADNAPASPPQGIAPTAVVTHNSPVGSSTTTAQPQGVVTQSSTSNRSSTPGHRLINIDTDLISAAIDTQGGQIVSLKLLKYKTSLKDKNPMSLLSSDPKNWGVLQSGLVSASGYPEVKPQVSYSVSQTSYSLKPGTHAIDVVLTGKTSNNLNITKTYHFRRNSYQIEMKYKVQNLGKKAWHGSFYAHYEHRDTPQIHKLSGRAFVGASVSSAEKPYKKISYSKLKSHPLSQNIHGGWVSLQQHYFLNALVPEVTQTNHYYSQISEAGNSQGAVYTVGFAAPQMQLAAGAVSSGEIKAYMGPEIEKRLKAVAKHLDLTIDYGWLYFFSEFIFNVMKAIHGVIGNWGWSIILVTLLIKVIFYPLANKSYKSMAKMKQLAPKMNKLKEIHANDKQALSKATMKLYREEKVNPLGGCLPMVVQVPVFIALYYVLIEAVQLRQAPFIFWIQDLSVKDPFYVLPILMGGSMFLQQLLTPQAGDPQQQKIMMLLPLFFTVIFLNFPAGLVLYWLTNNMLSIGQQWFVMRQYEKNSKISKIKNKKRR